MLIQLISKLIIRTSLTKIKTVKKIKRRARAKLTKKMILTLIKLLVAKLKLNYSQR